MAGHRITIDAGNLRDLSYIAAYMRAEDHAEISCQLIDWTPDFLAHVSLRDHCYTASVNGNPELAFGAACIRRPTLWAAWSWGTKYMWRAMPKATAFCVEVMLPDVIAQGGIRGEARAMASNKGALLWLKKLGATRRCELPKWGCNGETFVLYEWTA
jgi:hypothetical protein